MADQAQAARVYQIISSSYFFVMRIGGENSKLLDLRLRNQHPIDLPVQFGAIGVIVFRAAAHSVDCS